MSKTETIKKRAIYVYLPSQEMTSRWKDQAEKQGVSISKFVAEHVENSLRQEDSDYLSRSFLIDENRKLRDNLEEKEKRTRHLELLVEKLEEDLRRYRAQLFLDEGFTGIRKYDKKLVDILKGPGVHGNNEILSLLGVKPNEHEAIRAISQQLENLRSYGLVKSTPRGWVWVEE